MFVRVFCVFVFGVLLIVGFCGKISNVSPNVLSDVSGRVYLQKRVVLSKIVYSFTVEETELLETILGVWKIRALEGRDLSEPVPVTVSMVAGIEKELSKRGVHNA